MENMSQNDFAELLNISREHSFDFGSFRYEESDQSDRSESDTSSSSDQSDKSDEKSFFIVLLLVVKYIVMHL